MIGYKKYRNIHEGLFYIEEPREREMRKYDELMDKKDKRIARELEEFVEGSSYEELFKFWLMFNFGGDLDGVLEYYKRYKNEGYDLPYHNENANELDINDQEKESFQILEEILDIVYKGDWFKVADDFNWEIYVSEHIDW